MNFPSLLFPLSPEILIEYGDFHLVVNDSLALPVQPDHFSPIANNLSEPGIIYGVTSSVVQTAEQAWGFSIDCPDGSPEIFAILDALRSAATVNTTTYLPITVLDYVSPEPGETFTTRSMRLTSLERVGGRMGSGEAYQGIRFSMMEIEPRRLF